MLVPATTHQLGPSVGKLAVAEKLMVEHQLVATISNYRALLVYIPEPAVSHRFRIVGASRGDRGEVQGLEHE